MFQKSKVKKHLNFNSLGIVVFSLFFISIFLYLSLNIEYITDSDQSSNLIYAKELIANRTLLPTTWYFSTYVDLLNIDKIQALLFLIFDNWELVHVLANIITEILLLSIFYLICKELEINSVFWVMFIVLGGFSYEYYKYGLSFNIYSFYMALSYICFYLIIRCLKSDKVRYQVLLLTAVFFVSTSGIRNAVSTFVPAIAAFVVMLFLEKIKLFKKEYSDKTVKIIWIIILGFISGYLFYSKIMCPMVGYSATPLSLTSELLKEYPKILFDVIVNGWAELFGISNLDIFLPVCLTVLVLSALWCIKIIRNNKEADYLRKYLIIFYVLSSCAISLTFFISTSFGFETRYLMQSFGYFILIIAASLSDYGKKHDIRLLYVFIAITVIFKVLSFSTEEVNNSNNKDIININRELLRADVKQGYAGLWEGNILTEISDGEIEAWVFEDEKKLLDLIDDNIDSKKYIDEEHLMKWLQKKEHFVTKPEEPFFLIIKTAYVSKFNRETIKKHKIYEGENLVLMIFENYDELSGLFYCQSFKDRLSM